MNAASDIKSFVMAKWELIMMFAKDPKGFGEGWKKMGEINNFVSAALSLIDYATSGMKKMFSPLDDVREQFWQFKQAVSR